jgi:hypothetical protein
MAKYLVRVCRVIIEVGAVRIEAPTEDDAREAVEATLLEAESVEWDFYEEKEAPYVTGVEELKDEE